MENFVERLKVFGFDIVVEGNDLTLKYDGESKKIAVEGDWQTAIRGYYRSRRHHYEEDDRVFWSPKSFERPIGRLNQNVFSNANYEFSSNRNGKVIIDRATKKFSLAFFNSEEYERFFEAIIERRLKNRGLRAFKSVDDFLWQPRTIRFEVSSNTDKSLLFDKANKSISACLFKLSYEKGECWEPLKPKKRIQIEFHDDDPDEELNIPLATYDENLVRYYKVARSSLFPSQAFLAFYHILEYNFLKVSDESLYNKIRGQINNPEFRPTQKNIDRLITTIGSHKEKSDETEMLRAVLQKYVNEEELIDFINLVEKEADKKVYTNKRPIFGEDCVISTKSGHALSNSARIIKHIRNSLVHSSDRYTREDCHIPLTESEELVHEFVPLVRYMAEKIIFASASSAP